MIKDIGNFTIDLSKVEAVSKLVGSSEWEKYTIYFTGGTQIEFYDKRQQTNGFILNQCERSTFIELWKNNKKGNSANNSK